MQSTWSDRLWGQKGQLLPLIFIASLVMLFTLLGSREIWTQEHRWADIVFGMFYRNDFLHPYLGTHDYYDKPLLSYWLIAGFSFLTGHVSTWTLRLPSALAGLIAIGSIYQLGLRLENKRTGLVAAWLLLTTFYFVFWAKTSSADMLNMAGSLLAVCWYFTKKEKPGFSTYAVFFMILAVTSLFKGLVGAIVPLIVIFPDLMMKNEWKKHLRVSFILAMVPALIVYALPFWLSDYFGGKTYGESGLYLVYRENILRYFQPFDHIGPIYTYFIYLPLYLMPWAFFFIPAIFSLKSRWNELPSGIKSMCWAVLLLFIFFTVSGSRRNYYILPVIPFAILITANWIASGAETLARRYVWAGNMTLISFLVLFSSFDILQPLYYSGGGMRMFATDLKAEVSAIKPWSQWQFVMLDAESKLIFYMGLAPTTQDYPVKGNRNAQTEATLLQAWPFLKGKNPNTIFVSRKKYEPMLRNMLVGYREIEAQPTFGERFLHMKNPNAAIAFVPEQAL